MHIVLSRSSEKMDKYKVDMCAVLEVKWPGKVTVIRKKYMI